MPKQKTQNKSGSRKYGRNKRATNEATSKYSKGKITYEEYQKQLNA